MLRATRLISPENQLIGLSGQSGLTVARSASKILRFLIRLPVKYPSLVRKPCIAKPYLPWNSTGSKSCFCNRRALRSARRLARGPDYFSQRGRDRPRVAACQRGRRLPARRRHGAGRERYARPAPRARQTECRRRQPGAVRDSEPVAVDFGGHGIARDFPQRAGRSSRSSAKSPKRSRNLRALYQRLRGRISPTGEIEDFASPELREVRFQISKLRSQIQRSLENILKRAEEARALQDEFITIRNERYVIPIRNDNRGAVAGVVHGMSSSGQTAFVEPLETIGLNNELVRLRELEQVEITKVLFSITEELREEREAIEAMAGASGGSISSQPKRAWRLRRTRSSRGSTPPAGSRSKTRATRCSKPV